MNNQGQTLFISIIIAAMLFFVGVLTINLIRDDISTFRTALSCSDPSIISDGTKLACLIGDGVVPYLIVLVLSTAGGLIASRFLV